MSEHQEPIPPFKYIGDRDATERMKGDTKTSDFKSISECLGVSKGTISTWHQRGLTPYEVIMRLLLRTGASIKYLALGEGEAFPDQVVQEHTSNKNEAKTLFDVDYFTLTNGKLVGNETLAFDKSYLEKLGVLNVIGIEHDGTTFIVDKE